MTMINEPETPTDDWWWGRGVQLHIDRATAAIHMLHEQAHGQVPYVTCQQVPCCQLRLDLRGPAPRVLP